MRFRNAILRNTFAKLLQKFLRIRFSWPGKKSRNGFRQFRTGFPPSKSSRSNISEEKRNCILNLKYSYWEATPDYGIPPWYSCEDNGDVQIDEAYIRAILTLDSLSREEYKKILEETNEKAAECDALE